MTAEEETPVASVSTNLTRHDLVAVGSDLSASMMLADTTGEGHIMFATSAGPAFSMDTAKIPAMMELLREAETIRKSLAPLPDQVTVQDFEQ